jgi:MFS family permease
VKRARLPRDYWILWSSSTASNLGDGLLLVALPLLAVTLTDDPMLIAGITALTFLPWLVVGPLSGAIVDRVDKRKLIVIAQLARGLVALAFAVAVASGTATIWVLYATTVAIAVGETFADSASQAVVPRLVPVHRLEAANSRLLGAQMVTNDIAGGPLGAAMFAFAAALPFAVDAGVYLLAGLLLLSVRTDLRPAPAEQERPRHGLGHEIAEGLRYVFEHPVLRPLTVAAALSNLGAGATAGILVLFVVDLLALPELMFGVLLAVAAVGGVLGAAVTGRVVERLGRRTTMLTASAVAAVATGVLGLAVGAVSAAATLVVMFAASASFNVVNQSVRQAVSPDRILGRVITSVRVVALGGIPLGAMLGGVVARVAGLRAPFFLAAGIGGLSWLVLVRRITPGSIEASVGGGSGGGTAPSS